MLASGSIRPITNRWPNQPAVCSLWPRCSRRGATMADGKIAVMTGNVDAAKKQAAVLAELARLVSNSRSTEHWSVLAGDFVTATQAAANTTETNPQSVRQLYRGIAKRCDGCHEK